MNTWIIIASLLLFLFLTLSFSNINVGITAEWRGKEGCAHIRLRCFFGLIRLSKNINFQAASSHSSEEERQLPVNWMGTRKETDMHVLMEAGQQAIAVILRRVTIRSFKWRTEFGTGDASLTGTLSGIAWLAKGATAGVIGKYMKHRRPEILVVPIFNGQKLETCMECMMFINTGKAIVMMRELYQVYNFLQKNRRTEHGASNPGTDDNSDGKPEGYDRCEHDCRRSG